MRELCTSVRTSINVYRSGAIELSDYVVATLGLNTGDAVTFLEDQGNVYVTVKARGVRDTQRDMRGIVRSKSPKSNYFRLNWKEMAYQLLAGWPRAKFQVGEVITLDNGERAMSIITKRNYAEEN